MESIPMNWLEVAGGLALFVFVALLAWMMVGVVKDNAIDDGP